MGHTWCRKLKIANVFRLFVRVSALGDLVVFSLRAIGGNKLENLLTL